MRIISAAILGFTVLAGCTIGDQGGGAGGGGGGGGGGDDGAGPDAAIVSGGTPGVTTSVDRTTVSTQLGLTEMITVHLTSTGGYAGTLNLAPTLSGSTGTAITDITVTGPSTVALAADGTATAAFSVVIPTNADLVADGATAGTAVANPASNSSDTGAASTPAMLAATLSVAMTGGPTVAPATSAISVANEYTVTYKDQTGSATAKHFSSNTAIIVKRGALLVFKDEDTTTPQHITHGDGSWPHQSQSTTDANNATIGTTYVVDTCSPNAGGACTLAVGATGQLGCHSHGASTYSTFTTD